MKYLTREPIRIDAMESEISGPSRGAILTFIGVVREEIHPTMGRLVALEYEAYEAMAEKHLPRLVKEVEAKYPVKVVLQHRLGRLAIGEASIVIAVGGGHRDETYRASREVIEAVKHRIPVWKREVWERGTSWAEGCAVTHSDVDSLSLEGRGGAGAPSL